jgi:uncharacterized protein YcaQ
VVSRLKNFQRVYDLPERHIPDAHLAEDVSRDEAERELLRRSARALGVATRHDLADYFRLSPRDTQPRVAELVEEGSLTPVDVEGWKDTAYIAAGACLPRRINGASLLSPFDPMVWCRPRTERIFDFHYRIEIYVPETRRKWGYYVLPFRVGDRIVARVDLKADRPKGELQVKAAYEEPGVVQYECAERLADELRALADWLCLERVVLAPRALAAGTDFSRALSASLDAESGG